jgi:acyl carrier protein
MKYLKYFESNIDFDDWDIEEDEDNVLETKGIVYKTIRDIIRDKFNIEIESISKTFKEMGMDELDCIELIMDTEFFLNMAIPDTELSHLTNDGNLYNVKLVSFIDLVERIYYWNKKD